MFLADGLCVCVGVISVTQKQITLEGSNSEFKIYALPVAEWFCGRREVPGSIPDRASRPSRSEFSMVFSETRLNTG